MKTLEAYKTISEVGKVLEVAPSAIRFWEKEFKQIKPYIIKGRRYYSPENVDVLRTVKELLYEKGFTIAGAIQYLRQSQSANNSMDDKAAALLEKLKLARQELSTSVKLLQMPIMD